MNDKDIKAKVEALVEDMHSGQIEYAMELLEQAFSRQFMIEIDDAKKHQLEYGAEHADYDAEKSFSNDLLGAATRQQVLVVWRLQREKSL